MWQGLRADLKQVQTGLAVSGDGGVPVWHRAVDGGAGEVAQVVGAMEGLKELAGTRKVLLVGDSKLISRGNMQAMSKAEVAFIAPASKTYLPATQLGALDPGRPPPVDYCYVPQKRYICSVSDRCWSEHHRPGCEGSRARLSAPDLTNVALHRRTRPGPAA